MPWTDSTEKARIVARMAYGEASGWLTFAHAWVDPVDSTQRDLAPRSHVSAVLGRISGPGPWALVRW